MSDLIVVLGALGDNCLRHLLAPLFTLHDRDSVDVVFADVHPADQLKGRISNSGEHFDVMTQHEGFLAENYVCVSPTDLLPAFFPKQSLIDSRDTRTLIYCSIPPNEFERAIEELSKQRILTRNKPLVALEKPLGTSRERVDALLASIDVSPLSFVPVDHYLHKWACDHMTALVSQEFMSPLAVDATRIELLMLEGEFLVPTRAGAYFGAFYDMGVHLFSWLALYARCTEIDLPLLFGQDDLEVIRACHAPTPGEQSELAENIETYAAATWTVDPGNGKPRRRIIAEMGKGSSLSCKHMQLSSDSINSNLVIDIGDQYSNLIIGGVPFKCRGPESDYAYESLFKDLLDVAGGGDGNVPFTLRHARDVVHCMHELYQHMKGTELISLAAGHKQSPYFATSYR